MIQRFKKCIALIIALAAALAALSAAVVASSAVSYSGKGTKSDPYLVQTFEQLQGMKDKLSAHYKLDNTIDCSGKAFTPIGYLAEPFTGSFTCDTDADGTPKYAIKNLSVSIEGETGYTDYVANKSKWEAALFGCTSGAKISNIAVLNVSVSNTVIGNNQMNADWSKNPGQDEMASAALIGIAKKTEVEHCMSSGNIDSKSNHCGGLIGLTYNSTVKYCYSTVTVSSTGLWCHGGLIGTAKESDISYCYASGNVVSAANNVGGLIGETNSDISNCYSTGTVGKGGKPPAYGSLYAFDGTARVPSSVKDCFSVSAITGISDAPAAATNADGCYILNSAGYAQKGFQPASAAEINSIFSAKSGWKAGGSYPTIADIAVITDEAKYTPREITDLPASAEDTATDNTAGNTETVVSEAEALMTAEELTEKVDALMEKLMADTLSEEDAAAVLELKTAYTEMSKEEKAKLDTAVTTSLDTLYESAVTVIIAVVTEGIASLPEPDEVDASNAQAVLDVWEKYQLLPEDTRDVFTENDIEKLTKCYENAKQFEGVSIVNQKVETEMATLEIITIILLAVLNLAALSGVVYTVIVNVKTVKRVNAVLEEADESAEESEELNSDEI